MRIWAETQCDFCDMTNWVLLGDFDEIEMNEIATYACCCHSCGSTFFLCSEEQEEDAEIADLDSAYVIDGKKNPED